MSESRTWKALEKASTLAVLVVAVLVLVRATWPDAGDRPRRRPFTLPDRPLSVEGAPRIGSPTARVVIITYSDFECPFCGRFARDTWPALRAEYVDTGRVVVVFRNLPLPIHAFATNAAIASLCAGREGRFWQMHDALFQVPSRLSESGLADVAKEVGVDIGRWQACYTERHTQAQLTADLDSAKSINLDRTPWFLIGTFDSPDSVRVATKVDGARPIEVFREAIASVAERD